MFPDPGDQGVRWNGDRLIDILDFIAKDSPPAARRVVDDILARVEVLAEHPRDEHRPRSQRSEVTERTFEARDEAVAVAQGFLDYAFASFAVRVDGDPVGYAPVMRALNKATGATIAEIELPGATGAKPMTYMLDGRQYIIATVGWDDMASELVALALPTAD